MNTNLVCGAPPTIPIYGRPGTANASTRVFAEISELHEDGTIGNHLSSDSVKVTTTLFIMGNHTYYGQLYTPDLDTRFMWDCNLEKGTYQTPDNSGISGESYLASSLKYNNGFEMQYSYDFGENRGYTQSTRVPDTQKLSFVGNGGIKYGSTKGASAGVFEVAILDIRAMVNLILNGDYMNQAVLTDDDIKLLKNRLHYIPADPDTDQKEGIKIVGFTNSYEPEPLTRLLDTFGYGKDISCFGNNTLTIYEDTNRQNVVAENISLGVEMSSESIAHYLAWFFENTPMGLANTVTLNVAAPSSEKYGTISVSSGNINYYNDSEATKGNLPEGFDGRIYLQSHHNSCVVYKVTSITTNGGNQ